MDIPIFFHIFASKLENDIMEGISKRKELQDKEKERHEKYLKLLSSYSDEELENMSYFDLVQNGLTEYSDMGA